MACVLLDTKVRDVMKRGNHSIERKIVAYPSLSEGFLDDLEKARRHRSGSLWLSTDSAPAVKGNWAKRRFETIRLIVYER